MKGDWEMMKTTHGKETQMKLIHFLLFVQKKERLSKDQKGTKIKMNERERKCGKEGK